MKPALGRGSIGRSAISSALATASDFALVLVLVAWLGASPPLATFVGCVLGGVVNFTVNRFWAFGSDAPTGRQALRYLFVTASSALLNAGLMAAVLLLPAVPYAIAWWLVRGVVFLSWNYPLHRDWVFLRSSRA
jgi:putative flippase GtrA